MVQTDIEEALAKLPDPLSTALLDSYDKIRVNYFEKKWEPSELNGGKLCEVTLRILEWYSSSPRFFTPLGQSIRNFGQATRRFENNTNLPDSIRFHIPEALRFLYTLRNKRGVAHIHNKVSPNHMDSEAVVSLSSWVMAELVRLLNNLQVSEATKIVENIMSKRTPLVWEVNGKKRVLNSDLRTKDQILLLLYSSYPEYISDVDLYEWTGYSNKSTFVNQILPDLHKQRYIEYEKSEGKVFLSPLGIEKIEVIIDEIINHR